MLEYRKGNSITDPPQENVDKITELRIVCRPVVEYLRKLSSIGLRQSCFQENSAQVTKCPIKVTARICL